MTSPGMPDGRTSVGLRVDARRLWSGGVATALVAALTALVGVLVCRWLFNIPVLAPRRNGTYGDVHTTGFLLAAAAAALVATALVHLLLLTTPGRLPFPLDRGPGDHAGRRLPVQYAPLSAKVATALVDLVLGIVIGSLVGTVASRSVVRVTGPG
jgi:hypothetical protein